VSAQAMKSREPQGMSGLQALAVIVLSVAMMAVLLFLAPP
jgi:hypothetical protein